MQEYWHELPFPPPGDLPHPGTKPMSPLSLALADRFFTTEPPEKPRCGKSHKSNDDELMMMKIVQNKTKTKCTTTSLSINQLMDI